ncbi:MAG: ABC transporter permease subunit [Verrucomicrobiota bacterium]|nr:ABC transporter permease subunit [Verrucomicrobiota bacterium]
MNPFPIVGRELLVASRRRETQVIRFVTALTAIVVLAWMFIVMSMDNAPPHEFSQIIFGVIAGFAFFFCNLAGVRLTADTLSEEKRNGTLGLLFLTNLRGLDVVLGKMSACSVQAVFGLMAIAPVMMVPLLMGGVDPAEVGRMVGVLFAALFMSLSVGMACSALFKSSKAAIGVTALLILLLIFGAPIFGIVLAEYSVISRSHSELIAGFSTGAMFPLAFSGGFAAAVFYQSLAMTLGVGVTALGFAVWRAPRAWQDREAKPNAIVKLRPANAISHRTKLLNDNPAFWLGVRRRWRPLLVWAALFAGFMLWLWGLLENGRWWLGEEEYLWTLWFTFTGFKIWIVSAVCDRFREDRQEGALELLLATPLNFSDFSFGQARRLLWQFGLPLGLVLVTVPFMMFDSAVDTWPYYFVGLAILVADIWAMHFVGMRLSLTSRKPSFSGSGVALRILFLPWIIFLGVVFLIVAIGQLLSPRAPDWFNQEFVLGLWFFVCLGNNFFWGIRAMNDLKANFRQVAARAAGA